MKKRDRAHRLLVLAAAVLLLEAALAACTGRSSYKGGGRLGETPLQESEEDSGTPPRESGTPDRAVFPDTGGQLDTGGGFDAGAD